MKDNNNNKRQRMFSIVVTDNHNIYTTLVAADNKNRAIKLAKSVFIWESGLDQKILDSWKWMFTEFDVEYNPATTDKVIDSNYFGVRGNGFNI